MNTKKFNPFMYVLLRLTFIPYLRLKYNIKSENKDIFRKIKPPFILIPNHVGMFDPPMVNIFVPHRVHFVMSDSNLRTPIGKWAYLSLCRVIPKTKAVSDSATVRTIIKLVRKKRVICVFAEGRSTWDGVSHDIYFSTSKLLKILKIPVVVPLIQGGYLSRPRWATSVRRGKLVIRYKQIFSGDDLADLTPDEIHQRLLSELWNDDYEFQKRTGIQYKSKKGAEYLERVIFCCPACFKMQTMRSEGNKFFCQSCGFTSKWTPEGYLHPVNRVGQPTRSMTDWLSWQKTFCDQAIALMDQKKIDKPIFSDDDVTLKIGYKLNPLKTLMHGKMELYLDRFQFTSEQNEKKVFPISEITGVQVLLANQFEFYHRDAVYKFDFENPRTSGYKYMCVIQKIAPDKTELT